MRGAESENNPGLWQVAEAGVDFRKCIRWERQIWFGRRQGKSLSLHQCLEPTNRMSVKVLLIDAAVRNPKALCAETDANALGNARKPSGESGPGGSIQDIDAPETSPAQQARQPNNVDGARNFVSVMGEIDDFTDSGFSRQQFAGVTTGRNKKTNSMIGSG